MRKAGYVAKMIIKKDKITSVTPDRVHNTHTQAHFLSLKTWQTFETRAWSTIKAFLFSFSFFYKIAYFTMYALLAGVKGFAREIFVTPFFFSCEMEQILPSTRSFPRAILFRSLLMINCKSFSSSMIFFVIFTCPST